MDKEKTGYSERKDILKVAEHSLADAISMILCDEAELVYEEELHLNCGKFIDVGKRIERLVVDNRRWKSVDKEPPPVNEQLLFWHEFHKCSVSGWINGNEVIEKTRTTKWPLKAFTHWMEPFKTP